MKLLNPLRKLIEQRYEFPLGGAWGQREVIREWQRLADDASGRTGMSRRVFLRSQIGLAAYFLAMNHVFGNFFMVDAAEAAEQGVAEAGSQRLSDQFIFDVQVHFVHEDFPSPGGLLSLREAAKAWNPELEGEEQTLQDIQYASFIKEIFQQSQTKLAVLSNAPDDDKNHWFLSNEQALQVRQRVNDELGQRRLLAHAVFTPGQPGWMEELDAALAMKPDAMKSYTLGDPGGRSQYPWRLDDQELVYPAFEKIAKAGIRNICLHKGLLPTGYERFLSQEKVTYATVDDVGPAAKDWPELNFVVYHAAIQKVIPRAEDVTAFKKTGRIAWVSDLAEIPEKYGVDNVYGEIGATFGVTCLAHPELCAGILGTLIRGMGADHVCWGTDSVWFGSPQWQIEAFRRFEIPEALRQQYDFQPLGAADGPVKRAIFGENSARLYGIDPSQYRSA